VWCKGVVQVQVLVIDVVCLQAAAEFDVPGIPAADWQTKACVNGVLFLTSAWPDRTWESVVVIVFWFQY
jgi:hypothetical protein